jgi:hypothetical protein
LYGPANHLPILLSLSWMAGLWYILMFPSYKQAKRYLLDYVIWVNYSIEFALDHILAFLQLNFPIPVQLALLSATFKA